MITLFFLMNLGQIVAIFTGYMRSNIMGHIGPHFLCSISGVVPLTRDLSQAEKEINVVTR